MGIWLLQIGEPLPIDAGVRKMRTALLADELVRRGHSVLWWASTFEHQTKRMLYDRDAEIVINDKYTIRMLKGISYSRNVSLRRYLDQKMVARKFRTASRSVPPPDVILASMPTYELAHEAVTYAKARDIPVIVDVRDLWPDIILDRFGGWKKTLVSYFLRGDFRKVRDLLSAANALTAMSDGVLNWALNYADRDRSEWDRVYHHAYESSRHHEPEKGAEAKSDYLNELKGKKLCTFMGTHGLSYELMLVMDVAERFHSEHGYNDVHFIIAGLGENTAMLKDRAKSLSNVTFPGWLKADEISKLLRESYLGIVPCKSVRDAYPNKAIEYLSAGLPIVSSIEGELAALIDKERLGFNYSAGNAEGLYQEVKRLVDNVDARDDMSRAAMAVFEQKFDARRVYGEYVSYIEGFVSSQRSRVLHNTDSKDTT